MEQFVPRKASATVSGTGNRQLIDQRARQLDSFNKIKTVTAAIAGRLMPLISAADERHLNLDMSGDALTIEYLSLVSLLSLRILSYYQTYPKQNILSPYQLFLLYQLIGFNNQDLSVSTVLRTLVSTCLFVQKQIVQLDDSPARLKCVSELQCAMLKDLPPGVVAFVPTGIFLPSATRRGSSHTKEAVQPSTALLMKQLENPRIRNVVASYSARSGNIVLLDDDESAMNLLGDGEQLQLVLAGRSKFSPSSTSTREFGSRMSPATVQLALTRASRTSDPIMKTGVPLRFIWPAITFVYQIDPLVDCLMANLPLLIWFGQTFSVVGNNNPDVDAAASLAEELRIQPGENPPAALRARCEQRVLPAIQVYVSSIVRRVNELFSARSNSDVTIELLPEETKAIHSLRAVAAVIMYPQAELFELDKLKGLPSADKEQALSLATDIIPALISFSSVVGHRLITKPSWDTGEHWAMSILRALTYLRQLDPAAPPFAASELSDERDFAITISHAVRFLEKILIDNDDRLAVIRKFGDKALTNEFFEFAIRRLLVYVICELTKHNELSFNVDPDVEIERQSIAIVQRYALYPHSVSSSDVPYAAFRVVLDKTVTELYSGAKRRT